ncbi:hypothetical protein APED_20070 [Acanthopleuribacter pedis]
MQRQRKPLFALITPCPVEEPEPPRATKDEPSIKQTLFTPTRATGYLCLS